MGPRRFLGRRWNEYRRDYMFGIDADAAKKALKRYQDNKPLVGTDLEARVKAIETVIDDLSRAFGQTVNPQAGGTQ